MSGLPEGVARALGWGSAVDIAIVVLQRVRRPLQGTCSMHRAVRPCGHPVTRDAAREGKMRGISACAQIHQTYAAPVIGLCRGVAYWHRLQHTGKVPLQAGECLLCKPCGLYSAAECRALHRNRRVGVSGGYRDLTVVFGLHRVSL